MTYKVLHQVGHNANWNIASFEDDRCGDGLIFSPVHQTSDQISRVKLATRQSSFLDPQFYLPSSDKHKLHTFNFFPGKISGGFETYDFHKYAVESARACVQYQIENCFDRIVIPARFFEQMEPEYTKKQEAFTVLPFLEVLRNADFSVPIFITLPLTSHMITSPVYRSEILNWITTFPEISGVYLFVADARKFKQVQDDNFLFCYLEFCKELQQADLDLVVGYLNTDAILFSMLGDVAVTMGGFENTRMFSLDKFVQSDDDRRGPRSRIYIPGLLNWIQFSQAKTIREEMPELWNSIYIPTTYSEAALAAAVEPVFNQPGLYKHFFMCFSAQVADLSRLSIGDRYRLLIEKIRSAMAAYSQIDDAHIPLEKHGGGDHLQPWLDASMKFARKYIISR